MKSALVSLEPDFGDPRYADDVDSGAFEQIRRHLVGMQRILNVDRSGGCAVRELRVPPQPAHPPLHRPSDPLHLPKTLDESSTRVRRPLDETRPHPRIASQVPRIPNKKTLDRPCGTSPCATARQHDKDSSPTAASPQSAATLCPAEPPAHPQERASPRPESL